MSSYGIKYNTKENFQPNWKSEDAWELTDWGKGQRTWGWRVNMISPHWGRAKVMAKVGNFALWHQALSLACWESGNEDTSFTRSWSKYPKISFHSLITDTVCKDMWGESSETLFCPHLHCHPRGVKCSEMQSERPSQRQSRSWVTHGTVWFGERMFPAVLLQQRVHPQAQPRFWLPTPQNQAWEEGGATHVPWRCLLPELPLMRKI